MVDSLGCFRGEVRAWGWVIRSYWGAGVRGGVCDIAVVCSEGQGQVRVTGRSGSGGLNGRVKGRGSRGQRSPKLRCWCP